MAFYVPLGPRGVLLRIGTFVIGICLTLPGASYLAGMSKLAKLNYSTAATVLVVIGFCFGQLFPLMSFSKRGVAAP